MYPTANNVYSNYSALLSQGIHLGQMRQTNIHIGGMLNNNIQQNSNIHSNNDYRHHEPEGFCF